VRARNAKLPVKFVNLHQNKMKIHKENRVGSSGEPITLRTDHHVELRAITQMSLNTTS